MGNVKRKRLGGPGEMRRTASGFVRVALLLAAGGSSAIAIERDQSFEIRPGWSKGTRASVADESKAIARLIEDINSAARNNKQRTLSVITINTDVAGTTLEQERNKYGLSFGEVYVAHSLSLATRKKFEAIVALKKSGKSWAEIAREHRVTLKGSRELLKEMQQK